jgi:hypothetical protein
MKVGRWMGGWVDRESIDRQSGRQAGTQADRQTDRQIGHYSTDHVFINYRC